MSENNDLNQEVIDRVLDGLKTKISEYNYNQWFSSAVWNFKEKKIAIEVSNKFVRDWILDNYFELIKFEFFKILGHESEIYFQIAKVDRPIQGTLKLVPPSPKLQDRPTLPSVHFNTRYTFDNFVIGNSNQFVHAACQAVANNPAKNYNPLFIYGGVGLGKTHLLNAIGLQIMKAHPDWRAVFITGEQFTNEVINSIRYDKTYDFRKKFRFECDLLLIDDVQFIAGKERTMEEFFHTFNTLYEGRKQIIMTSDTLPQNIEKLEERLRSRFSWGLLADIQRPDFETRCAILRKKADDEGIKISDEICQFLAVKIQTNVRDLEGALIRVSAFASLAGVTITMNLVHQVLRDVISGFKDSLSIEKVQEIVANFYSLRVADLKSPRRHKNLALPRQIAMYLCKKHVRASYPEIGNKFGGKDHTTVIHAYQKISTTSVNNAPLLERISEIERLLTN